MKNKFLLFTILLLIPFIVNAENKCNIVSGNGKDIGSEIECAGEHFYVVENKEDSIRMLAKYNLDIGSVVNKVTVSAERYNEIKNLCSGSSYCDTIFEEAEFKGYVDCLENFSNEDGTHTYMIRYDLDPNEIKQNSLALGAHGDERGNPQFPEYGVVGHIPTAFNETLGDVYAQTYRDYQYFDSQFSSLYAGSQYDLNDYLYYLSSKGITADNINILSVKEINNIVYNITNSYLPLEEWGDSFEEKNGYYDINYNYYILGSIKEYLPEEGYEWLYATTYWTRTVRGTNDERFYFVDSLGNLCSMYGCSIALGAGIRPVIEISKDIINYNLTTETNNNGTIEIASDIEAGNTIVLNATPKKGYKLAKLIVKTESGTTIEVKGEDIIENNDGTISINPELFTMPLENIVVQAMWEIINPKTGVLDIITILLIGTVMSLCGFIIVKRYNERLEF